MTSAFSWQNSIIVFALLHSVFQGQICLLLQVFLDFFNYQLPSFIKSQAAVTSFQQTLF